MGGKTKEKGSERKMEKRNEEGRKIREEKMGEK